MAVIIAREFRNDLEFCKPSDELGGRAAEGLHPEADTPADHPNGSPFTAYPYHSCYDKLHMRLTNIIAHDATGAPIDRQLADERVQRAIFDILEATPLCSMSTVTPDGRAHINTAYFCHSEELELYFLTHPRSTHCQNLRANSSVAISIFSSNQQWPGPDRGVQLFGTVIEAQDAEAAKAEELYTKRFSAYDEWKESLSGTIAAEYKFYRFVVLRLKVLDEANIGDGVIVSATIHRT
jgi:uncharacterized protein YhbP (UPF0306 family)